MENYRIFVASPGDLAVERDVLEDAVKELNLGLGQALGIRLDLVRWETHVTPSLGSDPQAVVTEEVGDDYQIFIGILWTRFGTPTPRAASGTLEEFERARSRWLEAPDSVDVMFYFKDEPVPPKEIVPDQLAKVLEFRESLSRTAVYGTFVTAEDLGRLVRIHLTRRLTARTGAGPARPNGSRDNSDVDEPGDEEPGGVASGDEELEDSGRIPASRDIDVAAQEDAEAEEEGDEGLLDLVEESTENTNQVGKTVRRMAETMTGLNERIRQAKEEVENATSGDRPDYKKAKKSINSLAGHMKNTATQFESDILLFRKNFEPGMDAFVKMPRLAPDFGEKALESTESNRAAVSQLVTASQSSADMVADLRSTIQSLPRVTTEFNRAKKRLLSVLSHVQREFSAASTMGQEAVAVADEIIAAMAPE